MPDRTHACRMPDRPCARCCTRCLDSTRERLFLTLWLQSCVLGQAGPLLRLVQVVLHATLEPALSWSPSASGTDLMHATLGPALLVGALAGVTRVGALGDGVRASPSRAPPPFEFFLLLSSASRGPALGGTPRIKSTMLMRASPCSSQSVLWAEARRACPRYGPRLRRGRLPDSLRCLSRLKLSSSRVACLMTDILSSYTALPCIDSPLLTT